MDEGVGAATFEAAGAGASTAAVFRGILGGPKMSSAPADSTTDALSESKGPGNTGLMGGDGGPESEADLASAPGAIMWSLEPMPDPASHFGFAHRSSSTSGNGPMLAALFSEVRCKASQSCRSHPTSSLWCVA